MKQVWEIKKLGEVVDIINGRNQSQVISENGEYPIYGSAGNLMGYATDYLCEKGTTIIGRKGNISNPIFIEERFWNVDTAFGLFPKNGYDPKFINYLCQTIDFKSRNRGTTIPSLVKSDLLTIVVPFISPLPEQQRIVSILNECFAAIDKAKTNAEQNLKNAKELFESYLQGVFENGNWEEKTIEDVCNEIFAGGDAPKNNYSLEPNEKHNIPIYANAVKDRGLYGYTDFARVTKPCVTIAARGSGTGHTELRDEAFSPIVRLIVCIPDTNLISSEFLKYTIDNLVIQRSGSAIPQLTVPMIKDYKIPVPTIEEQKRIIEKAKMLKEQKENLENVYLKKIEGLEELKKSILQKAFAGELRSPEGARYTKDGCSPSDKSKKTITSPERA